MTSRALAQAIEADHAALREFMSGNSEPKKAVYSRQPDVTLANPLGPPALGWTAVERRLDQAAAQLTGARDLAFDRVSLVESADLAYAVEIEHYHDQMIVGSDEPNQIDLRVSTVFRLEESAWRIVHRHADPIMTTRGIATAINRG